MTTNKPLTPEETAWANANADQIRQLIQKQSQQKAADATNVKLDPLASAAHDLIGSIRKQINTITTQMERKKEEIESFTRMAASEHLDTAAYAKEVLEKDKPSIDEEIEKFTRHIDALNRKLTVLENNPEDAYLPIGTVVRFEGVPDYVHSLSLSDDRKSYPLPGSIGVVTGLRHTSEYALAVSMRKDFKDGWGYIYEPDYDHFPTYKVDRSMVSVIEYGKLPDGTDYKGYGFQPTHTREADVIDPDREEMILECDGHFWRFHDFGGTQGIEALQAYDQLEEMSWIIGPKEEYEGTTAPKM
jgi:hypothetical protein